ncbi:bifunctional indole-3-glycerol-phosphate synthase TrpC/phosphoribosylanthranilate isomerase TrpF [Salinivibrio socompensis]|uniref:bifunctional indole-3-glycerol-phosphate synthase TrpC/phosphoribosylanthranilate isomerase TrpF n=1 Tax=Salinivibrio socompensis TaxID=1510206 RepID=UPI00046F86D8|nr:bifunctional indole-3-glycerol-phosphate synthase TrpC/phosphoribosylanthranilate isomerase TrpF [Salinivibrio socompensis]
MTASALTDTILGRIVDDKKRWVAARKQAQPLDSFVDQLTPSDRDFRAALAAPGSQFILECKKASPSKGVIREDFDPANIARAYKPFAAAISVLTDEDYFQGRFDFLPIVREQVDAPVLCKDFIIDPYQVYLARHYQADAILLMLSVLDDAEYRELAELAESLKLGVLTEVSTDDELARANALGAVVIGINNRNLRDLSIDRDRTKRLAPQVGEKAIVISESGIDSHRHVRDLAHHADGFLIGSALMAEPDLTLALRKVILGDNKVCGLTSADDALAAYDAGAVYGGLIFVEHSPRAVSVAVAERVQQGAPLRYVGVFQNHTVETVAEHAQQLNLYAVQLHGDEDAAYLQALREKLPEHCEIWKAHGVSDAAPALESVDADRHLIDSRVGQQSGGTGKTFDWHLIPKAAKDKVMIAGGLSPDNAAKAAEQGCLGLDFNSGVEHAPGVKDAQKLNAAFRALRRY